MSDWHIAIYCNKMKHIYSYFRLWKRKLIEISSFFYNHNIFDSHLNTQILPCLRTFKEKNLQMSDWHIAIYQSSLILTALFQHNLINVSYLTACYLYQVMMTLHFLYVVANDAESTQK